MGKASWKPQEHLLHCLESYFMSSFNQNCCNMRRRSSCNHFYRENTLVFYLTKNKYCSSCGLMDKAPDLDLGIAGSCPVTGEYFCKSYLAIPSQVGTLRGPCGHWNYYFLYGLNIMPSKSFIEDLKTCFAGQAGNEGWGQKAGDKHGRMRWQLRNIVEKYFGKYDWEKLWRNCVANAEGRQTRWQGRKERASKFIKFENFRIMWKERIIGLSRSTLVFEI